MKPVWIAAFVCAFASLVSGVVVILFLALSGQSYAAYSVQCVLALVVMAFAWSMLRKYRQEL